jgi:sugar phosphate isomerase/epimerase
MPSTTSPAVSVQLFSVRDAVAADLPATLSRLADVGFTDIEPFGIGMGHELADRTKTAEQLHTAAELLGLSITRTHAAIPAEGPDALFDELAALGVSEVVIPHPSLAGTGLGDETFADPSKLASLADRLSELVAAGHDRSVRVGYHNHAFEWAPLPDGHVGFDWFLANTPDDLFIELDAYWAATAGQNPVDILRRLGTRAIAVHLKDGPLTSAGDQVPFGTGAAGIAAVIDAVRGTAVQPVLEVDQTAGDPVGLLADNLAWIRNHH